jgi:hypothetical protein
MHPWTWCLTQKTLDIQTKLNVTRTLIGGGEAPSQLLAPLEYNDTEASLYGSPRNNAGIFVNRASEEEKEAVLTSLPAVPQESDVAAQQRVRISMVTSLIEAVREGIHVAAWRRRKEAIRYLAAHLDPDY